MTTPRLDAALGLVAEVAREPTFAPAELERLRDQTLDALKVSYADPGDLAGLTAARLAYGSGAWGHPASGTPASLPRISRADLVALHRAAFRPDRAVLILAGDIGPEQGAAPRRGEHFGSWAAAGGRRAAEAAGAADPRRRPGRGGGRHAGRRPGRRGPRRAAAAAPTAPSAPPPTCSTRCSAAAIRRA